LGFELKEIFNDKKLAPLNTNLTLVAADTSSYNQTWQPVWGTQNQFRTIIIS